MGMGTRSILAVPDGDAWKGRYCHWDGYPTWMGRNLWALVARSGLETTQRVLTEHHYGWSQIDAAAPDLTGVVADMSADYDTLAYKAYTVGSQYGDGRFGYLPGWGITYTEANGVDADAWETPAGIGETWCEWLYILSPAGLWVQEIGGEPPLLYRWDDGEPEWERVEGYHDKAKV